MIALAVPFILFSALFAMAIRGTPDSAQYVDSPERRTR